MSNQSLVTDRLNLTDAEIVSDLNALTVRKTDSSGWTWSGLGERFPIENIIAIRTQLAAIGEAGQLFKDLLISTPGVNFALDKTQEQLEAMRPVLGSMVDVLKAIGVWYVSPRKNVGNVADVTVDEVAEIRTQITADAIRVDNQSKWATLANETLNPLQAISSPWSEIKTALIAALETM